MSRFIGDALIHGRAPRRPVFAIANSEYVSISSSRQAVGSFMSIMSILALAASLILPFISLHESLLRVVVSGSCRFSIFLSVRKSCNFACRNLNFCSKGLVH